MQKGNNVLRAQAIPFILINEKKDANNKVTYEFELQRKAVDIFMAIKNKKLAIATVAGPQRSGKSFLSNRLLKRMTGFAIGPSTMPCTKGLWIWGQPIEVSDDSVLIIMDTEGLNSVQRDINVDLKIFSLSILLSSVFIYNSLGIIDEKALQNMSYVLRITQNIRMKSQSEGDAQIAQCFPFFYWVLRDFHLDLKGQPQNDYLQGALMPISKDEKDPKNQIRAKIRKLFTQRKCQCFPRPIHDEDKLAHIQQLHFQDLRQKFRDKMKQFQKTFYETLPPKLINGKPLTSQIYLNLVREYLDAINHGKVPQVLTSLERVIESQARQITQNLMAGYRQAMNKVFYDKPVDQNLIQRNHRTFVAKIEVKIDQKLKNWLDVGRTADYKNKLLEALQKDFKERKKKNDQLCTKECQQSFSKFQTSFYQLPTMQSTGLVSDAFFKQKFTSYTKLIKEYMQKCKAPRKYFYFMQKFPKQTLDYMELFIARAKGVFNNEANKIKVQTRSHQATIQSLNRIMKQQENLLSQKEKQIEVITYQKDTIRRQFQKNQKIKELQKQTEKMSKNELKKNFEQCKVELFELQKKNQELEETVQKLRGELASKKNEISQMVKKNTGFEVSESTQGSMSNLPNDVVSVLSTLKQKLTIMKDFYDKNVKEESFQESMLRQLQEQRAQKHKGIQKQNEKHNTKIADLRQRLKKDQGQYQKNIKLLNLHIDDLKTQNMDLQKQNSEIAERKGGNFISERKNLEQAIRLKNNNINSLKALTTQKDKKIGDLQYKLASLSSQVASLQSYRQTFPYILGESLSWIQGKNSKLKHSIGTLTNEDEKRIKKVFKQLQLNPPF